MWGEDMGWDPHRDIEQHGMPLGDMRGLPGLLEDTVELVTALTVASGHDRVIAIWQGRQWVMWPMTLNRKGDEPSA